MRGLVAKFFVRNEVLEVNKKLWMSVLCIALAMPGLAQDNRRLQDASAVLKEVLNDSGGIPQITLDKSLCVVVYPSVKKIGAGVGGEGRRGGVNCRHSLVVAGRIQVQRVNRK